MLAVLDWELSTLGHPLADFSYHLMMYRMPAGSRRLAGRDLAALNIPSEADYVAAYCRRTGRDGIPDLDFYMAFNLFRLAGIVHGIKGRVVRGTASSAHAARDGGAARAARRARLGAGGEGGRALATVLPSSRRHGITASRSPAGLSPYPCRRSWPVAAVADG